MKNYICLLVLLFIFSCSKKQEAAIAIQPETNIDAAVGTSENGVFTVSANRVIKPAWESLLKEQGFDAKLEGLKIISGKTSEEVPETYHLLTSRDQKLGLNIAALLYLKNGEFYLQKKQGATGMVSIITICKGACTDGCAIEVTGQNEDKMISCSACMDCTKSEIAMQ